MVAFGRPFYHGGLINRRTALRALYGELVYLHLARASRSSTASGKASSD